MREGKKYEISEDNADVIADWKDNPQDVMEAVDKELRQYGLEVVTHSTDGDYYAFSIEPIEKK